MKYVFAAFMIIIGIVVAFWLLSFLARVSPPVLDAASRSSTQAADAVGFAVNREYYERRGSSAAPVPTVPVATGYVQPKAVVQPVAPAAQAPAQAKVENIGLWVWQGNRPPFPPPASAGQVYAAHGDIDGSGSCGFRVFGPGQQIAGLGEGTFRIVRITGSQDQILTALSNVQEEAAKANGGSCPTK